MRCVNDDIIVSSTTAATSAVKRATSTISILVVAVNYDPIALGYVDNLARPGGNVTGNTVLIPDLGTKRLQLLREAIPTVVRVAYLVNPDNVGTLDVLAELKLAAPAAGMAPIGVEFGSATDFDAALAVMLRERTEVLLVSNEPFHQLHVGRIIDFLAQNRIAGMFQTKENVAAGGFMSYGASVPDVLRGRVCPTCSGAPPAMCTASCKAPSPLTCRWSCRRDSISPRGRERISLQVESGQTPEAVHVQKMVYELE